MIKIFLQVHVLFSEVNDSDSSFFSWCVAMYLGHSFIQMGKDSMGLERLYDYKDLPVLQLACNLNMQGPDIV